MVSYNTSFIVNLEDLTRILNNIKIAEAHAAGGNLVDLVNQAAGGVASPIVPFGLRTVDGSFNHLLPGDTTVGAADTLFPRLLDPAYRTTTGTFELNGTPVVVGNNNYDPTNPEAPGNNIVTSRFSVVDAAPRTISNLIVDQTFDNMAAVVSALMTAGSANALSDAQALIAARDAALAAGPTAGATAAAYIAATGHVATLQTEIGQTLASLTALRADIAPDGAIDDPVGTIGAALTNANEALSAATSLLSSLTAVGTSTAAADISAATSLVSDLTALRDAIASAQTNVADGVSFSEFNDIITAESNAQSIVQSASSAAAGIAGSAASTPAVVFAQMMEQFGLQVSSDGSIAIPNVSPDIGLSPPNSGWMTLFGQFFDHGLDLVTKGGNGTVFIPLQVDDKFYDLGADGVVSADDGFGADGIFGTADDKPNFMALSRATMFDANGNPIAGGTESQNTTTPFVDQNQTYTSNASHQVFLREYMHNPADGRAISTGHLLTNENGGIGTWKDVKNQAKEMLGLTLIDQDVHDVPQLLADPYGKFIPGAHGFAQLVVDVTLSDGSHVQSVVEGRSGGLDIHGLVVADLPAGFGQLLPTGVTATAVSMVGTGHAFLNDIAHSAEPGSVAVPNAADANDTAGTQLDPVPPGVYDNELLDRHFITGDGRGNENIGLTSVHFIFHHEHDRVVEADKITILRSGDVEVIKEWLLDKTGGTFNAGGLDLTTATDAQLKTLADSLVWDGERLFQAARFTTEMQYQHMVFEEFARRVQPNVDPFVFTNSADIDPSIVAEFAHVVYRFGHSMLTDSVDRLQNDLSTVNGDAGQIRLIDAFLNPAEFTASGDGTVGINTDVDAASNTIRGMSRQVGNEIDEFVVDSLRNFLVGQPLDLPALNIARGRDTGIPGLNGAREQLYAASGHVDVKPYTSWLDFAQNMKHPISLVNFIAAYGTHTSITSATTIDAKRDAALELVFGTDVNADGIVASDRLDFLNATGSYAGGSLGGLNDVDLWIGGLAEEVKEFGGQLGSTFNFVFEYQLEQLQNGDRFYYLSRTQGMNLLNLLEANTFSDIIMRNTNLGDLHATHLSAEIMEVPDMVIELDELVAQQNYSGDALNDAKTTSSNFDDRTSLDIKWDDPIQQAIDRKVVRVLNGVDSDGVAYDINRDGVIDAKDAELNMLKFSGGEHVVLGGTEGRDYMYGDKGIDTLWGDGGDDYLNAGMESDQVFGGDGDDIIEDPFGDDFLRGEGGDDVVVSSSGIDVLFGGTGQDFVQIVTDSSEVFAGPGDDFVLGGSAPDGLLGNEGDDWIEGGEGFDGLSGENSELFFNSPIVGHDILWGQANDTDYDGENGDDIMVQGSGIQRNNGMEGFDWAIHKGDTKADGTATDAVSDLSNFLAAGAVSPAFILRDRFDSVEGLSGWSGNDTLSGASKLVVAGGGFDSKLTQAGVDRIDGLKYVIGTAGSIPDSTGGVGVNPLTNTDANAVVLTSDHAFDGGEIILGGAGNDVMMGALGNDIMDGDAWLNVRISVHEFKVPAGVNNQDINFGLDENDPAFNAEIFTVNSLTEIISGTGNAAWDGHSLADLMRTRVINPGQLKAVREVLNSDGSHVTAAGTTDDGTIDINGVFHGDVDTAAFRFAQSEYILEGVDDNDDGELHGAEIRDADGDGFIRIEHVPVGQGGGALRNADGIDLIRNFEVLRFADGIEIIQAGITNHAATGTLGISVTAGPLHAAAVAAGFELAVGDTLIVNIGSVADLDGLPSLPGGGPDLSKFTFVWQQERTAGAGDWVDITHPVTGELIVGQTFAPTQAFGLDGLAVRVVGRFTDAHGLPEVVTSDATAPLAGTAPVGSVPPAELGVLLAGTDPAGDPAPGIVGIFEDGGPLLITPSQLLAGVFDLDTPTANLLVSNLAVRIRPGDPDPGLLSGPDINGNWTFTPAQDFNGGLVFTFDVSDGTNPQVPLEATLEVAPVNDAPANPDALVGSTLAGIGAASVTFTTANLFGGTLVDAGGRPIDVDGDRLTIDPATVTSPNGTVAFDAAAGIFTWTPNAGTAYAENTDIIINFQIDDGTGLTLAVTNATARIDAVNEPATGAVTINDTTPNVGQTLSATSLLTDVNGVGPVTFSWEAFNGTTWDVVGTGVTFTPGAALLGQTLRVTASFIDQGGTPESGTSAVTAPIAPGSAVPSDIKWAGVAPADGTVLTGDLANGLPGAGTVIANLATVDADSTAFTYSLAAGSSASFAVSAAGVVTRTGTAMASNTTYTLNITSTDESGQSRTETFTIRTGTNSVLLGANGIDSISLGANTNDTIVYASGANDTVTTGSGNDTLFGQGGNDALNGGTGSDTLNGGGGNDSVSGGGDDDVISYTVTTGLGGALTSGRDFVDGGTNGTAAGDRFILTGTAAAETFRIYTRSAAVALGVATNAQLNTNTEIVVTRNGTNNASIIAELDNVEEITINTVDFTANDGNGLPNGTVIGGDTVNIFGDFTAPNTSLNFSTITINGSTANDTVDISGLTSEHRIVFNSGGGADTLVGAPRAQDVIDPNVKVTTNFDKHGTSGKDSLSGGSGDDSIWGRANDDRLYGLDGDDELYGEAGNDKLYGGAGRDDLDGGTGNDYLSGGSDRDEVRGGAGNDTVQGGDGADHLKGGAGNDRIIGGEDKDRMSGDGGSDIFVFDDGDTGNSAATRDVIEDFQGGGDRGGDLINLSGIDAITGGSDNAFTFIGQSQFTGLGQLRVSYSNGSTIVEGNVAGNASADFQIELKGTIALSLFDFAL